MDVVTLVIALAVITVPFALAGIVTTLAITRTRAPVGRLYAADLFGAAAGCLAAVVLLDRTSLSAAAFAATAAAAMGTLCFRRAAGLSRGVVAPLTVALALIATGANVVAEPIHVRYTKARPIWDHAGPAQPVEQPRPRARLRASRRGRVLLGARRGR